MDRDGQFDWANSCDDVPEQTQSCGEIAERKIAVQLEGPLTLDSRQSVGPG